MQLETVGPLGWNVSKMLGQYCRGTWGARTIPQVDCGFLCIVDTVYICCDNRVSLDNSFFLLIMTAVMVPVSSTVIPLPVYKVVYNLGVLSKDKKTQSSFKPEGAVKLITNKKGQEKKT
ncbi:uncharacterized protein LOC144476732 isoform X2 [Augochlora pura]